MKYLGQLGLIFALCLVGDLAAHLLPFSLPGSVVSMLLVLVLLASGLLKERHLGESADFLLRNMTFFFIPPAISIIRYTDVISAIWWQLILVNLVSVVICFAVSAWTAAAVIRLQHVVSGGRRG
ncbi:MAG: CidA/LrgA family protein [Sphaerochaeta sp.]|jgi:holin-like protein|nr:CidA/LrgA family protein [Sphaerochaeta sp.]MDX9914860.1 CidA/LrgA family protein [Sphaerochaeta sp.]